MDLISRRLAAFILAALLAAPGAALADGWRSHYGKHDWRNYRQPGHTQPYERHLDHRRHNPYRGAGQFHAAPWSGLHRRGHDFSLVPPWPGYGCRPVVVIDRYRGTKAHGTGSLCFDSFGRAFVVPGHRSPTGYRY